MIHEKTGINVDLSIGLLPFEHETIERSKKFVAEGVEFYIPTPEDLIIMKAVSHRPKDLEDIRTIVESQARLDIARIKHWITEFARVLEMPDIYDDLKKIISKSSMNNTT